MAKVPGRNPVYIRVLSGYRDEFSPDTDEDLPPEEPAVSFFQ